MAVNLSPIGNGQQFFDNNGVPLAGGLLYTYVAGSSTPLSSYTDSAGTIANTNPIVFNSAGRPSSEIWLTYGSAYKLLLADSSNNMIWTLDNISGIVTTNAATAAIPSGTIIIWSGAVNAIPSGYYLCNGSNGTPDLRDKFVVGAGNSYAVGATANTSGVVSTIPAYYALAYIYKI
jgi:hypothetical protein